MPLWLFFPVYPDQTYTMYQKRTYRILIHRENLVSFQVAVKETDLCIHAAKNLNNITRELVFQKRGHIEAYISRYPEFGKTLEPWHVKGPAPNIIQDMIKSGKVTSVGPMAAVAGAIAEHVGIELLSYTDEVVVENGGDVFLKTNSPVKIGIFAGTSPLSLRIGLRIASENRPMSVCTSSGTVGHSLSLGNSDAVCAVSESCSLADAAATSIGNHVKSKNDIQKAIDFGNKIEGITGLIIIMGDKIGVWGGLEIVPLDGKRG